MLLKSSAKLSLFVVQTHSWSGCWASQAGDTASRGGSARLLNVTIGPPLIEYVKIATLWAVSLNHQICGAGERSSERVQVWRLGLFRLLRHRRRGKIFIKSMGLSNCL